MYKLGMLQLKQHSKNASFSACSTVRQCCLTIFVIALNISMIIAIGSLLTCLNMITDILIYRLLVGPLAGLSVLLNMLTN